MYLLAAAVLTAGFVGGWCLRGPVRTAAPGKPATAFAEDAVVPVATSGPSAGTHRGVPLADASPVQLTPGAAGYDGVRAARWLGLTTSELFEREPRDAAWASAMEEELAHVVEGQARATGLDLQVLDAECRTSSCRTLVEIATSDEEDALVYFQGLAPLGTRLGWEAVTDADGRRAISFTTVFEAAMREPADYRAFFAEYQRRHADKLEGWRAGRRARQGVVAP